MHISTGYRSKHKTLTQCWLMLVHHLRRWPNINPTLVQCLVFVSICLNFSNIIIHLKQEIKQFSTSHDGRSDL